MIELEHETEMQKINSRVDEILENTKQYISTMLAKIAKESKEKILASLGGKPIEPAEVHSWLKLKVRYN